MGTQDLKPSHRDRLIGVFLIAVSASSFGTMAIFARLAYEAGSNPVTVLFLRFTIAAIFMVAIMTAKGMAFPRGRTLITLLCMGGLGYVGLSLAFFTALTMAPAGLVAILLYLYPAFVTLLATIFFKKPVTILKMVALSMTLGGTIFIVGLDGGRGEILGIVLATTAAVLYSIYIIVGSKAISNVDAFAASTTVIIAAGVVFSAIVAVKGVKFPTTSTGWVAVFAIALVSTALAIVTFFAGLKRIDPANASMISTLEPVVTVVLAIIVLGEAITMPKILGGVMILAAVALLAKSETNSDVS
ncbi:MAG: DMT family transporter [Desulfobacteraceae bacterium]|nr:DMT family transporter [Desulfobacteraceae bacterium]